MLALVLGAATWVTITEVSGDIGRRVISPTALEHEYCPMWEVWHRDRKDGVPIDERYGWPDPERRYYEDCEQ